MTKKNFQYSSSKHAPSSLENEPFYGFKLDDEQKLFRNAIYDPSNIVVVCDSKAGTGKTTIALGTADILVQYGFYNGIVYIVSPTMEERQGYLPGRVEEKIAPYMEPLIDAMLVLGIPQSALIRDDDMENQKNGKHTSNF